MKTRTLLWILGYGVVGYFVYKAVKAPARQLPVSTTNASTFQNLSGTSEGKTSFSSTTPRSNKTSPAAAVRPAGATAIEYARRVRAMQFSSPGFARPSGATAIEYARRRVATPRDRRIAGVGYVR